MKTIKIALLGLISLLSACTTVKPDTPVPDNLITREFTATLGSDAPQTKTHLDGTNVLWDASGESIAIIDSDGLAYTLEQTSVSDDYKKATFAGDVPGTGCILAVYPAIDGSDYEDGMLTLEIPVRQDAVENSFASGTNAAISKVSGDDRLYFKNIGGLLGFTVNANDIASIRFSATESSGGALTGPVLVGFDGEDPDCVSDAASGSGYVELTGNIQSGKRYFAIVAPGTYEDLQVVFTTSAGRTATFTKDATLTVERSKALSISAFTIREQDWDDYQEPVDDSFYLVTDASELQAGDEVLIVYREGKKALGSISSNGNYREPASVTIVDGTKIESAGSATILTLESGSSSYSGTWSFKDGSNYLASTSSGNNLVNVTGKNANSSWTIEITSSNQANIRAKSGASQYIRYNTSSPRFSCYNSSTNQQSVAIFSRRLSGMNVSVTTGNASSISLTGATLSGSWSHAGATVREAGFQIGTSESALDDVYQADITSAPTGSFSVDLTLLEPSVTYYYRAYVILQDGSDIQEFTGSVKSFTTTEQPDIPPAGAYPGWAELPVMNIATVTEGGKQYMINSTDNSQYYAWHICPDFYGPGGKLARNYTVCYSAEHHCPVWVAAPRHKSYETGSGRSNYSQDPSIPKSIQYSSTETGGGCNKGHMLGSAERTVTSATNKQVFYYTNIAPQLLTGFNTGGGGWNLLEDYVDKLVCSDTLYVVIGCYFERYTDGYGKTQNPSTISFGGRSDVHMPTMFYYVLLRTKSGSSGKNVKNCNSSELQCAAFVRTHTNDLKGQEVSYKEMMSVSALEQITGVTYFPNVPNAPKDSYTLSDWGLKVND